MTALPPSRQLPGAQLAACAAIDVDACLAASGPIRRLMRYRKFVGQRPLRVLLLDSGYHVQAECRDALRRLGHTVNDVDVKLPTAAAVVRAVLAGLVRYRPDMVLCVNHLGFDDGGTVGGLFAALKMPVACWYVDSPFFVLRGRGVPGNDVTSLFVWERTLLGCLRALGAQDVHYLPLGCDPYKFPAATGSSRYGLGFVGNSMQKPGQSYRHGLKGGQREWAARWKADLLVRRQSLVEQALQLHPQWPGGKIWDALAAATYSATGVLRARLLAGAAKAARLHIFGDKGWADVLPGVRHHPMVPYGLPLARLYADTDVNLNATSLQMPTAVNQRIFDVPSAGGFVLSDDQADVHEHFVVGKEAITYQSAEELEDLVRFYAARPQQRRAVVAAAQARIAREHTYDHRLRRLVDVMQQRHRLGGRLFRQRQGASSCAAQS